MNKFLALSLALCFTQAVFSQAVYFEPADYSNPDQPLKILVNLEALNTNLDHTQRLIQAAQAGENMYIWTWRPFEFTDGHPKANGFGPQPWKNSNELLRMTREQSPGLIYSYVMTPTEFYEVSPAAVFQLGIHFLVKPKDGGGFGDPDIKSEDLSIEIFPASLGSLADRNLLFQCGRVCLPVNGFGGTELPSHYEIFDYAGRQLQSGAISGLMPVIDFNGQNGKIYLLRIFNQSHSASIKFIY